MDAKSIDAAPAATAVSLGPPTAQKEQAFTEAWQKRLLPVMTRVLIGLTIFFFITTILQLAYLTYNILQIPDVSYPPSRELTVPRSALSVQEQMDARQLDQLSSLEAYLVKRRYYRDGVILSSSLWLRYLGFTTGMILALVGASFILGKLQEPTTELETTSSLFSGTLKTASPGIVLALLGAILIYAAIIHQDTLALTDGRIYLPYLPASSIITQATPTPTPMATPFFGK
jgi:hypothetical protein